MKKSELIQLIREEIQEVMINPQDDPKGNLMGKINDLLDDAEKQIGVKEVASVINTLYQRYKKDL
jgi:hypothetical protein